MACGTPQGLADGVRHAPVKYMVCIAGLDARAAATVMQAVKKTSETGRTVVCTIHQPSMAIFGVCFAAHFACPLPALL